MQNLKNDLKVHFFDILMPTNELCKYDVLVKIMYY